LTIDLTVFPLTNVFGAVGPNLDTKTLVLALESLALVGDAVFQLDILEFDFLVFV
jgi:hypothetical protein